MVHKLTHSVVLPFVCLDSLISHFNNCPSTLGFFARVCSRCTFFVVANVVFQHVGLGNAAILSMNCACTSTYHFRYQHIVFRGEELQ